MLDLIIIGGGISGLTLAYRAVQQGLSFQLLESAPRLGGLIRSQSEELGVLELGPDALMLSHKSVADLLRELGLEGQAVAPSRGVPWMARRGHIYPLPEGFRGVAPTRLLPFALTPLLSWWGKVRVLADLLIPASRADDQTLAEFIRRRMGREMLEQLAQPLLGGIYAADPHQLSLAATMPHLLQLEKTYGSLLRGLWKSSTQPPTMASLPLGLSQLTRTLEERVMGHAQCSTPVSSVLPEEQGWRVETPGRCWHSRRVVMATSAPHTSPLVGSFDPFLGERIKSIACRSVAVLNQIYATGQLGRGTPGCQGFLVPLSEQTSFSAVSLAHKKWPERTQAGYVNLRIHLGGAGREDLLELADGPLTERVTREIAGWLDIQGEPLLSRLSRHPQAMPEYRMGHRERVREIEERVSRWNGLQVTGNWLTGVGIGECISRAGQLAQQWKAQEAACKA